MANDMSEETRKTNRHSVSCVLCIVRTLAEYGVWSHQDRRCVFVASTALRGDENLMKFGGRIRKGNLFAWRKTTVRRSDKSMTMADTDGAPARFVGKMSNSHDTAKVPIRPSVNLGEEVCFAVFDVSPKGIAA